MVTLLVHPRLNNMKKAIAYKTFQVERSLNPKRSRLLVYNRCGYPIFVQTGEDYHETIPLEVLNIPPRFTNIFILVPFELLAYSNVSIVETPTNV